MFLVRDFIPKLELPPAKVGGENHGSAGSVLAVWLVMAQDWGCNSLLQMAQAAALALCLQTRAMAQSSKPAAAASPTESAASEDSAQGV